jgi:hypothetical protein
MDLLYITKPKRTCPVCSAFRTDAPTLNKITADLLYARRTLAELAGEFREPKDSLRRRLAVRAFRSHAAHCLAREVSPFYFTSPALFESGDSRRKLAPSIERVVTGFYQDEQWRAVLGTADRLRLQAEALRRNLGARRKTRGAWSPASEALEALARSLIRAHKLDELAVEAGLADLVFKGNATKEATHDKFTDHSQMKGAV